MAGDATTRPLSARHAAALRDVLAGTRPPARSLLLLAGPAVIASIAYTDPGNFSTNIAAGAAYGYDLLWVVLAANLVAALFQALSARLGLVTGRNLAELCRDRLPPAVVWPMWVVSEVAAMATDLAEFVGGAIGFSLLVHVPLLVGMVAVAIVTAAILMAARGGYRPMELAIGVLVAAIAVCFLVECAVAPIDWAAAGLHAVTPRIPDAAALTIAVGIIGATVMPHALYLHSGLTQARPPARDAAERRLLVRWSDRECVVALSIAGAVNLAMVMLAAAAFHAGHSGVTEIGEAYRLLTPLLGTAAAVAFLLSLLASGVSSSVVGTMAGELIMQGFVGFRIPVLARRAITVVPAFVVIALGVDATRALVLSQVVLSFALPLPMVALVAFSGRRDVMGEFASGRLVQAAAIAGTVAILALNAVLLLQTFGVPIPGLPA